MIFSKQHSFLFIKGVKVAGTSIEIALSQVCGENDIITPITPIDEIERIKDGRPAQNYSASRKQEKNYIKGLTALEKTRILKGIPRLSKKILRSISPKQILFYNHMSLAEVQEHISVPSETYIFCIERCPYRKVISWANMQLSMSSYKKGGRMAASPTDLKRFLDDALQENNFTNVKNINRYRDINGNMGVHHVLHYENLHDDFNKLLARFNVNADIPLPHAKKGLMSNELPIHDFLKPEHIKIINHHFHEEFTHFGYPMISERP